MHLLFVAQKKSSELVLNRKIENSLYRHLSFSWSGSFWGLGQKLTDIYDLGEVTWFQITRHRICVDYFRIQPDFGGNIAIPARLGGNLAISVYIITQFFREIICHSSNNTFINKMNVFEKKIIISDSLAKSNNK